MVLPQLSVEQLQKDFASNLQIVRVTMAIDPAQSKQLHKLQLPDIFLQSRTIRTYPDSDIDAQMLGYVPPDGTGVNGIEEKYNTMLAGKAGNFTAETDLNGNPLTVGSNSSQQAVNGADITLTINNTIQYVAQRELVKVIKQSEAQSGSVVVLNVHTGAVVALAGAPTFDPNHYGTYADQKGCIDTEAVYYHPD